MLPFAIHLKHGEPAYEQILSAVRKALYTGRLRDGDAFPSVRVLSQELRISPTTAHKVVSYLKAEGVLAARPGIGMVVTAKKLPDKNARKRLLAESVDRLVRDARDLSLNLKDVTDTVKAHWNDESTE